MIIPFHGHTRRLLFIDTTFVFIPSVSVIMNFAWAEREGGGRGPGPSPLKNHKNIEFLSNTGPEHLKIKKLPMLFNVGPSSARQRNAI